MSATIQHLQPDHEHRRQAGFSLVELMVAVTLGLLILLAMSTLLSQQNRTRDELDKSGAQVENGRYALSLLQNDIQHAGYLGQFGGTFATPGALPNPCTTDTAAIQASLALPVQGYDAPASPLAAPLSGCLPDANHVPGTDILVIRRLQANDALPTLGSLASGQVYVQTNPLAVRTDVGPTGAALTLLRKDLATPAEIRAYVEHIYFISPCNTYEAGQSVCTAGADGGAPVPTLKRIELGVSGNAPAFVTTPLVEGIEDMQLDYGIDIDGAGSPSTPFVTAPTLAQWPAVMAVSVTLLARNTTATQGYSDTKTYDMGVGGTVGPFDDNFKRHVYAETIRLINPSGRRE